MLYIVFELLMSFSILYVFYSIFLIIKSSSIVKFILFFKRFTITVNVTINVMSFVETLFILLCIVYTVYICRVEI